MGNYCNSQSMYVSKRIHNQSQAHVLECCEVGKRQLHKDWSLCLYETVADAVSHY